MEVERDWLAREAILAKPQHTLEHQGSHRGYARLIKVAKATVTIDQAGLAREARLDGKIRVAHQHRSAGQGGAQAYRILVAGRATLRELKTTLMCAPYNIKGIHA